MKNIANSFANLCSSYINLADRFQQLDVEHMVLKSKIVSLLKGLQRYRQKIANLQQEKQALQNELLLIQEHCKVLMAKNESLKTLEPLLGQDITALLAEATEQSKLVGKTIAEIESNCDPDLSVEEKALLQEFYEKPEKFVDPNILEPNTVTLNGMNGVNGTDKINEVNGAIISNTTASHDSSKPAFV